MAESDDEKRREALTRLRSLRGSPDTIRRQPVEEGASAASPALGQDAVQSDPTQTLPADHGAGAGRARGPGVGSGVGPGVGQGGGLRARLGQGGAGLGARLGGNQGSMGGLRARLGQGGQGGGQGGGSLRTRLGQAGAGMGGAGMGGAGGQAGGLRARLGQGGQGGGLRGQGFDQGFDTGSDGDFDRGLGGGFGGPAQGMGGRQARGQAGGQAGGQDRPLLRQLLAQRRGQNGGQNGGFNTGQAGAQQVATSETASAADDMPLADGDPDAARAFLRERIEKLQARLAELDKGKAGATDRTTQGPAQGFMDGVEDATLVEDTLSAATMTVGEVESLLDTESETGPKTDD